MKQKSWPRYSLHALIGCIFALIVGCGTHNASNAPVAVDGSNMREVTRIANEGRSFGIQAKFIGGTSEGRYRVNEPMSLEVTSAEAGRLWVLQVSANDKVDQLFPNARYRDNTIAANRGYALPPTDAKWSFVAAEPVGPSRLLIIVTTGGYLLKDIVSTEPQLKLLAPPDARWSAAALNLEVTRP